MKVAKVLATCLSVHYNYLCDTGYIRSNLLLNFVIMRRNLKKHSIIRTWHTYRRTKDWLYLWL